MIPIGTTSRQVEAIARWMLVLVACVGMLMWWWPSFAAWGAAGGAMLIIWAAWFIWKTAAADRTIPGHPIHLALLGPLLVWGYHLAKVGLGRAGHAHTPLDGNLDVSAVYQLLLIALTAMLTQSLLARGRGRTAAIAAIGLAMIVGPLLVILWGKAPQMKSAMVMLAAGGAMVTFSLVLRPGPGAPPTWLGQIATLGVLVLLVLLGLVSPTGEPVLILGVLGVIFLAASLFWPQRRRHYLLPGLFGVGWFIAHLVLHPGLMPSLARGVFGRGEGVFDTLNATHSGLEILLGAIGWGGVLWLIIGCLACSAWLMRAWRFGGSAGQGVIWSCAACITTAALFMPGGLFSPGVTLAVGVVWGLAAVQSGRPARRYPGWLLGVILAGSLLLLGISDETGIVLAGAKAFGYGDWLLHALAGALSTLVLCWLMGCRRLGWGLAAIAISVAIGALGELAQYLVSSRDVEFDDFHKHAMGSLLAAIPYLLLMGARLQESALVTHEIEAVVEYHPEE